MKILLALLLSCSVLVGTAQAQNTQTEHAFFDKTNVTLLSISTGLMVADLSNTAIKVGTGKYREVDPLYANLINHHGAGGAAVSAIMAESIVVGMTYLFHKTGHHKLERLFVVGAIADSTTALVYNNTQIW